MPGTGGEASGDGAKRGNRGEGGYPTRTVWRLESDQPVAVAVRTGLSDGSVTEVVEGPLQAGDLLITDAPSPAGASASGAAGGARRPGPRIPGF